jgi:hypothetical protein
MEISTPVFYIYVGGLSTGLIFGSALYFLNHLITEGMKNVTKKTDDQA